MKRLLASLALIGLLSSPALADGTIDTLLGAAALVGTESVPIFQTANPAVKTTSGAIGNAGTLTGDATKAASSTAVTLATVNANVGSFGSATNCVAFTTNGKGLITAASAVTCTPAIASVTGLGTGIATALGVNVGTAGSVVVNGGALGTPSSGVGTNLTGTAAGLTAGNVTTNANLTGMVTSVGNAASLGSFTSANLAAALTDETGTGANVFGTAPTISSPTINTAATLGFITGSTQCLQVNTSGVVSGTGAVCGGSGSTGANPTATASDTAVNGVATTFMRSDGAPAIQKASNAQFGLMEGDGTSVSCTAGVCSSTTQVTSRTVTGATDTILAADRGNVVYYNSASAIAVSQLAPTGSFAAGFYTTLCNINTGVATVTPGSGTIGGASTFALTAGTALAPACISYQSDGTNFKLAGGVATSTIASGTAALGTSAIASAACATVVTATATGTATTDVVTASFNGDPTAVTGYIPATAGMLTIITYPTANTFNAKVCNNTSASITPGAITLNWRVVR